MFNLHQKYTDMYEMDVRDVCFSQRVQSQKSLIIKKLNPGFSAESKCNYFLVSSRLNIPPNVTEICEIYRPTNS